MVDTSTTPSLKYMEFVPDKAATTLLPIIQQHVLLVTTDEWSSYRRVGALSNVSQYDRVIHSLNFVAPNGVHTQNVEPYWSRSKIKLKRMKGVRAEYIAALVPGRVYVEGEVRQASERLYGKHHGPHRVTFIQ